MARRSRCATLAAMLVIALSVSGSRSQPDRESRPADRPVLVAQVGHALPVASVAFSPDGRLVLTGSFDRTARLWDIETGREIRRFEGHTDPVSSVAFSPDGRSILTGTMGAGGADDDRTARHWDIRSGREIRRFLGHSASVRSVAFSPDGRQVLTGSFDKTARLWDTESGRVVRKFEGHTHRVASIAFSSDGRRVATGSFDGTARLWDPETGQQLQVIEVPGERVLSVAFSPDGHHLLTSGGKSVRLWDAETGQRLRVFEGHTAPIWSVAFSPDGRRVLTGSMSLEDMTCRLWDTDTGQELRRFEGSWFTPVAFSPDGAWALAGHSVVEPLHFNARLWELDTGREAQRFDGRSELIHSVAISPDGRRILTGSEGGTARLWNLETGRAELRFVGHEEDINSVAFSPDGSLVVTGSGRARWKGEGKDFTARTWDAESGREIRRLEGHTAPVSAARFSPDGRQVVTGSDDKTARLWSVETGQEIRRFLGHEGAVNAVAISSDSLRIFTGSSDKTAGLWDVETGRLVRRFRGHVDLVSSVALSPDGLRALTASSDKTVRLWDTETGRELRRFEGDSDPFWTTSFTSVAFSADGRRVLTGSFDTRATLWDADTGKELLRLRHADPVSSVACSADGSWLVTGSFDCSTRLWNAETGNEACRLISFQDGTWAVVDLAGRFDASNGGAVEGLHWVVGLEPISLDQLKERYYDPGLLAKYMGFNEEPLREVAAFDAPKLFPSVEIDPPVGETARLSIRLRNRGGGLGRLVVRVNGKEVTADARGPAVDPEAESATLAVDLAGDPRLVPGEENTIEVLAYNAEGYLHSRGLNLTYTPPGEAASDPPELWAVVAGVSDYSGDAIDLRYAAKDAEDFAAALSLAAERLFGKDRVHLTVLTGTDARRPTRTNLLAALDAVREARPKDLLVVYLSGHGVNVGGQDGDFHFLTADARSAELADPEVRRAVAISSRELTEVVKELPPLKQVLVLDTCASGRLVEKLTERRDVPGSQVRALERLKDRTGLFVLAGCASDAVSYEATRYAQGLLTHSLLLGMKGAALREEEYVDVSTLFGFAADRVPKLARDVGGIQRPVIACPRGASFDIGRLTEPDRAKVPLQTAKPIFLRCSFQEERRPRDSLKLGRAVEAALRNAAAAGRDAPLVFVDAEEMPGAFAIWGRYSVKEGVVVVSASLWRGEAEVASFTVEGSTSDAATLATRVVEQARSRVPR